MTKEEQELFEKLKLTRNLHGVDGALKIFQEKGGRRYSRQTHHSWLKGLQEGRLSKGTKDTIRVFVKTVLEDNNREEVVVEKTKLTQEHLDFLKELLIRTKKPITFEGAYTILCKCFSE